MIQITCSMHFFPTEFQMHRKIETTKIQYLIDNFSKPNAENGLELKAELNKEMLVLGAHHRQRWYQRSPERWRIYFGFEMTDDYGRGSQGVDRRRRFGFSCQEERKRGRVRECLGE